MSNEEAKRYTQAEEYLNAFSHALGALFAIYAIVMLAVKSNTPLEKATTAIYGAMLFILFQSSTCYHAMTNETAKKVFRKIDHSAIYLLIAGTYTPLLMITVDFPYSVVYMAMIWYLLGGGLFYTFGSIFYLSNKKFMHTIWHLCVLAGAILHYMSIEVLL